MTGVSGTASLGETIIRSTFSAIKTFYIPDLLLITVIGGFNFYFQIAIVTMLPVKFHHSSFYARHRRYTVKLRLKIFFIFIRITGQQYQNQDKKRSVFSLCDSNLNYQT